jgi:mannose/cellobiose epimerase-like protein (N-acyl-D-glucosamine 2-epimerase family)
MSTPDFRSRTFLVDHVRQTLAFYHPRCIDPDGGFFHFFRDDGTVYDARTRHLVSSTRFVVNFAMAWRHLGESRWRAALEHGVAFLRAVHRDPRTGGYVWVLSWERGAASPIDATNHCYGLAFVVLAHAHALMAGMAETRAHLDEAVALLDGRFWEQSAGLYADEASPDWSVLDPYRGQNANMHACEAMLAAWEATRDGRFLARAEILARNITVRQAALASDLVWEHYHADWSVDWEYNRHDRSNIFRPWGYQPGHLAEWAKLLLILERHRPAAWLLPRAVALFDAAVTRGWDAEHGGLVYGFARRRRVRQRQVLLGAGGDARRRGPARRSHRGCGVLALVRSSLGLLLGALRRPPPRRLVPHSHAGQPEILRREESGGQGRLSHHGRVLGGARRPAVTPDIAGEFR